MKATTFLQGGHWTPDGRLCQRVRGRAGYFRSRRALGGDEGHKPGTLMRSETVFNQVHSTPSRSATTPGIKPGMTNCNDGWRRF